jgi:photosystem II stability/assembly factor-like uncharacterized protein
VLIPGRVVPEGLGRGPRKARSDAPPSPRLVNHKARSIWFQARAAWPVREAAVERLVRQREAAHKSLPAAPGTSQWEMIGPTNIGGRLTCVVCDPVAPDRIWVGSAGGGVWFSPDAGQTWRAQWHDQDVLNVGALAIDAQNPQRLYCGTGEANLSADSYAGVGIYRTLDGGATWQLQAEAERTGVPRRIGVIAIDPFDSDHLILGGVGFGEMGHAGDLGGMHESLDGGVSWTRRTFPMATNYWCHAVVFDHTQRGVIYSTITARSPTSGIYRSADGGATWQQLTKGLPATERFGRTALAISHSNPRVLYAFATDEHSGRSDLLLGVFKTTNGGSTWTNVAGTHFRNELQISYGNTIAVHPTNSNHVLCGGVDLHLTTDGGRTWTHVTKWDTDRGSSRYAHADHHGLLMPAATPGRVYDPNDGGLDVSTDGGKSWTNRSDGLAVTMYYDVDVAQSDERALGGGAQDNGTLVTASGRVDDYAELLGGDGGWIIYDPRDARHVFASYYNLNIYRFHGQRSRDVSPPATKDEKNAVWMAFMEMSPADSSTLFVGSRRVWRTKDDGETWAAISPVLDGSSISAIDISSADPRRVFVATENGGFYRSLDGGTTWSANLAGPLPGHIITRIAASPINTGRVFISMGNFGHGHVFRSDDGGSNWRDVDGGQLPDVPHHALLVRPDAPNTVYVCGDAGVYVSSDAGATWMNLTRNLPRVMVVDLVLQQAKKWLVAATYGRSVYRLRLD